MTFQRKPSLRAGDVVIFLKSDQETEKDMDSNDILDDKDSGPEVQINFPSSVMSRIEEMMGGTEQFDSAEVSWTVLCSVLILCWCTAFICI